MLWNAVLFGLLGAVVGLRYRAPALIPVTLLAAVWGAAGWMVHDGPGRAAMVAILPLVLNAGYLVAIALRTVAERCPCPPGAHRLGPAAEPGPGRGPRRKT